MNRKTSWIARVLALVALVVAVIVIFVAVSGSSSDDADPVKKSNPAGKNNNQRNGKKNKRVKVYKVQPNDTLTGIAEKNGVTVERIQQLNPELDPQALQAGAKLKLR